MDVRCVAPVHFTVAFKIVVFDAAVGCVTEEATLCGYHMQCGW